MSDKFDVEIIEVSEQPEVENHPMGMVVMRKIFLWRLNREWFRYKAIKPRNIFLDLLILIRRLVVTVINRDEECRRSVTDSYVTEKHLRAWGIFLEMKSDFLICFEDDAVFKKDSLTRVRLFLKGVAKYEGKPVYFDLAGGVSPDLLNVKNLEFKNISGRKYYRKPVTNTGCCYLISRPSARIFFFYLLKNPGLRLIGADWLLNKLFILSTPKYRYICYHADPPIFANGSATGNYSSWLSI